MAKMKTKSTDLLPINWDLQVTHAPPSPARGGYRDVSLCPPEVQVQPHLVSPNHPHHCPLQSEDLALNLNSIDQISRRSQRPWFRHKCNLTDLTLGWGLIPLMIHGVLASGQDRRKKLTGGQPNDPASPGTRHLFCHELGSCKPLCFTWK